jgi:hypothetical protein
MEVQVLDDPKEAEPEVKSVSESETKAVALRDQMGKTCLVTDQASYDIANGYNKRAKEIEADFRKFDDEVHESITASWQKSCKRRKKVFDACSFVYDATATAIGDYLAAQKAKALEEQRKAEEIARKEAEDAALATAQALQDEGLEAQAEAVLEAPVVVQRIEVAAPAMDSGTSLRTYYSAEVKDLMALVKSVAEGKTPLFYIMADQSKLDQWARLSKGAEAIPGVEVKVEHKQSRTL